MNISNLFVYENNFKMDFVIRVFLISFLLVQSVSVVAISRKERDSLLRLPLFKNDKLLEIELKTNLSNLLNDIGEDRKYHKCQFRLLGNNKESESNLDVEVMTRGNFRRRKQNCDFPPLRFKIPTEEVTGTEFEGQSKLKYVSHCQSRDDGFEQNTIKEYLIYKMYNLIDDHSFRVRLSRVLFIDALTNDSLKKFGFFLEDKNDLASRNGKVILHYKNLKQYNMLRKNMVMLSLFQLMIGNSDWDVSRLHNIDILSMDEHSIPVAVPFDFDWSGIINQAYFTLDPQIAPDAKYKRKYKGYKWRDEELETAFSAFNELKESFLKLISQCEYLNEENKTGLTEYVLDFYELISSKKDIRDVILKKSPKIPSKI
ncbi:hypothetical protein [Labilibaculum antarcticum]|uniref:Uncharacterized protein n=1 Tax=Labilibaculum antarcticum TaxID=1717717 RepID=A0A1Y1CKC4_9BACT|nr:hypothetical protein [Labilibaculum antarcticum]BAX80513.1 hypothetical protein ALGA_2175 [Labilibaculum antarcticum]